MTNAISERVTFPRECPRSAPRILMLVPHEPYLDPRVQWATDLCADLCRTDVIGWSTHLSTQASREYDGTVYTELVNLVHFTTSEAYKRQEQDLFPFAGHARLARKIRSLLSLPLLRNLPEQLYRHACKRTDLKLPAPHAGAWRDAGLFNAVLQMAKVWHERPEAVRNFLDCLKWWNHIIETLYVRGRAVSFRPRFILCHDVYGLIAAVRLKRVLGCPVVYDSHELWSEGKNDAEWWEVECLAWLEGQAIRHADRVITVSPFIADHLRNFYQLPHVTWVPNAEPLRYFGPRSFERGPNTPIRFAFQGGVAKGRGVDSLLDTWIKVGDPRAVLVVRAPETEFLASLREQYAPYAEAGLIEFAPAVPGERVIETASQCDVGIIPYAGPNRNHIFACPNKLAQYMQAGVAIMHHRDEIFVTDMVKRHGCGRPFELTTPESLREAISFFVSDQTRLLEMKKRAWETVRQGFNWETWSTEYRRVLEEMYHQGEEAS